MENGMWTIDRIDGIQKMSNIEVGKDIGLYNENGDRLVVNIWPSVNMEDFAIELREVLSML